MLPCGGEIGFNKAKPQVLNTGFYQVYDAFWYFEETKSSPEDATGNTKKCIGQIKENDFEIFLLLLLPLLNLVLDHASVLQTSRET